MAKKCRPLDVIKLGSHKNDNNNNSDNNNDLNNNKVYGVTNTLIQNTPCDPKYWKRALKL